MSAAGWRRQGLVGALCLAAVLLFVAAGCNRPRKVERAAPEPQEEPPPRARPDVPPAPDKVAPKPQEAPAAARREAAFEEPPDPTEMPAPEPRPEELKDQLKRLKHKARRDVVWARTTISNIPSYQRALEKFAQEFEQWGVAHFIPSEPQIGTLRVAVEGLLEQHGFELVSLNIRDAAPARRELPEVIYGNKAFAFEPNDFRGVLVITGKVKRPEAEEQQKLAALRTGFRELDRLVLVRRIRPEIKELLLNLEAYYFLPEQYPLHQVEERRLEVAMEQVGITLGVEDALALDPVGYLQNAALSYKEFNASLHQLNEAMKLLSRSRYLEARSAFFRKASAEARGEPGR